ncbi:ABC1 kinase family protein [Streptomyces sp. Je 1-369]|uniref:ABC1 kinase family protein n=1 Tax=Streptomyces sp. Je 1-369 TaxID=2966192 RepID=UPI0022859D67|nr:AarF/UbiB family protein [Streptomyces sp. Je 1-369]WAL93215.1 AarF/UbiB family protein [Streptomyces sp. Je 1-369]
MSDARLTTVVRVFGALLRGEAGRRLSPGRPRGPGAPLVRQRERARALRVSLESLGPFYMKVGQMLATRPDLVSAPVMEELQRLHDHAAAEPFSAFTSVLEEELGPRWSRMFAHVRGGQPLGTASLAQVYGARMLDGREVVIKVQRPGVQATVEEDMRLLRRAARLIAYGAPGLTATFDLEALLGVLFDAMRPELDFTREAGNMEEARPTVERFRTLYVPAVVFASPRVLVQSMAPGCSIRDFKRHDLAADERLAIGSDLLALMHRGYFVDRRFHADPHPGNILIQSDGQAAVIDWGMVGRIDRRTSAAVLLLMLNLTLNDGTGVANAWLETGRLTTTADPAGFISDITAMVPQLATATLAELDFGQTLSAVMRHSARRGIGVNPAVAVLGKSFANIDGSVRCLAPEVQFTQVIRQHLQAILLDLAEELLSPAFAGRSALEAMMGLSEAGGQLRAVANGLSESGRGGPLQTFLPGGVRPAVRRAALLAVAWAVLRRHSPTACRPWPPVQASPMHR